MAEPFIGEIRLFAQGSIPRGWMSCEGQTLQISTNQALYSILGIMYGGDGRTTFKLPDLSGRAPLGASPQYPQGQAGGEAKHALTAAETPNHTHQVRASSAAADKTGIHDNIWASTTTYADSPNTAMSAASLKTAGAGMPHQNMQPYLAMNYCIAILGIYPSRQ